MSRRPASTRPRRTASCPRCRASRRRTAWSCSASTSPRSAPLKSSPAPSSCTKACQSQWARCTSSAPPSAAHRRRATRWPTSRTTSWTSPRTRPRWGACARRRRRAWPRRPSPCLRGLSAPHPGKKCMQPGAGVGPLVRWSLSCELSTGASGSLSRGTQLSSASTSWWWWCSPSPWASSSMAWGTTWHRSRTGQARVSLSSPCSASQASPPWRSSSPSTSSCCASSRRATTDCGPTSPRRSRWTPCSSGQCLHSSSRSSSIPSWACAGRCRASPPLWQSPRLSTWRVAYSAQRSACSLSPSEPPTWPPPFSCCSCSS
mmetsp:Transcript_15998/g.43129  ORF Transcript_15998/g.43129 Transcript_15998/m.43129 type:complete len:317 (-) Transcript_15998:520-1470(-)